MRFLKNTNIFFYIFFTLLAFYLRFYLLEDRNSWHDEWHSVYVSDPSIPLRGTFARYLGNKGDSFLTEYYPILYLLILKYFFSLFGYFDDNGRILSLIFGFMCVPLSMFISQYYLKNKQLLLVGILASCNLFLIWQSLEIRAHSILVFSCLTSIVLFYEVLKSNKFFINLVYCIFSIFTLSLWPISGAIFFGKFIYLIQLHFLKKEKPNHIYCMFLIIPIIYLFLNIDYLILNTGRDFHYTSLYKSFFYNYHFRTFFSSVWLGAIFLLLFSFIILKKFKVIFLQSSPENLLYFIIFSSYILTLSYTLIRGAAVMSPKYVIFIVPLICIVISNFIYQNNYRLFLSLSTVSVVLINLYLNYFYWPIDRPDIKSMLQAISKSSDRALVSKETDVFNNYLKTKKLFHKHEFILFKKVSLIPNHTNGFWTVCLNHPRFAVGENKKNEIDPKCIWENMENYKSVKTINIPDLIFTHYKKK